MSKLHDMLKKADYYSSPVTKEQVNKLRQLRNQARAQGKKFNVGDHVSAGAGQTLKNVYDTAKAGAKGWAAGAWSAPLKVLQLAGSDWADKKLDDLSQWSGASRGSLDTGGAIGAAGYATLLSALAGAGAAGTVGANLTRQGLVHASRQALIQGAKQSAGTAAKKGIGTFLKQAPMKAVKWYTKSILPYDIGSATFQGASRYLQQDKLNVAKALAQGDTSSLSPTQLDYYNKIIQQKGLGNYNPSDPQARSKYIQASQQLMDSYGKWNNVAGVVGGGLSYLKPGISSVKGLLRAPKNWKSYASLAYSIGLPASSFLGINKRPSADWQLQYTPGMAYNGSSDQTAKQRSPLTNMWRSSIISHFIPQKDTPRAIAAKSLTQDYKAATGKQLPKDYIASAADTMLINQRANNVLQAPGYQSWIQRGLNSIAGSELFRGRVQSGINKNFDLFRQLGAQQDPIKRQEIMKQLIQQTKGFNSPQAGMFDQAGRAAFKSFMEDPQARQRLIQRYAEQSSSDYRNMLKGYQLAQADPRYARVSGTASDYIQQAQNALTGDIAQGATKSYIKDVKGSKDLYSTLNNGWGDLIDTQVDFIDPNSQEYKITQQAIFDDLKKNPFNIHKALAFWARSNGYKGLSQMLSNGGLFYGGLTALVAGVPMTVSLINSLLGGNKRTSQVQAANTSGGIPTYKPRDITERGIAYG